MGSDQVVVKHGDTRPVPLTAAGYDPVTRERTVVDLSLSTLRLIARPETALTSGAPIDLDHTVTDAEAGEFTYNPDGTLPVGRYVVELEQTQGSSGVFTYPTRQDRGRPYFTLIVEQDLG